MSERPDTVQVLCRDEELQCVCDAAGTGDIDEIVRMLKAYRRRKKPGKFDPLEADIPLLLDTPAFREAWAGWCEHRREIKHPLTKNAVQLQLSMLLDVATQEPEGVEAAVALVNLVVMKGWRGLDRAYLQQTPLRAAQNGRAGSEGGESGLDRVERALAQKGGRNG
jgi:hypothetical protein